VREGGHSMPRVVHAGGAATGAEIERALVEAVRSTAAALLEQWFATDLIVENGRCSGVTAIGPGGSVHRVRATHVLLASGGVGQLFAVTTNPSEATGDGMAMAWRANAAVADVEFMQFHPTALHHPAMPRRLLSEALRGHGALLRDSKGHRFVDELSPRDVVSRAMARKMTEEGLDHLWLDATDLEDLDSRFPTIAASLREVGLDPSIDWLPIAPAAHYMSGGVVTDLAGASMLPGLWVAGEAACTGVHGANRLASNSLLEGMVFGARVVEAIEAGVEGPGPTGAMRAVLGTGDEGGIPADGVEQPDSGSALHSTGPVLHSTGPAPHNMTRARERLQEAMTAGAGVVRSRRSLACAASVTSETTDLGSEASNREGWELKNLATVAGLLITSASARRESRGAHTRAEFPDPDDRFRRRLVSSRKMDP
ncbi:MAG: L-aspartate oxidase, partial [Acidimicrobiales bacterium]